MVDFLGSGFERLLPFYLASCDYLVDIDDSQSQNTAIDLRFHYHRPSLLENPQKLAVEAGWSPDFLTFEQLAIVPREGDELRIIPRYNSNAVFRISDYHTDLRYSLETPLPWLNWDEQIQGFRGIVPMYSEIRGTDSQFGKVYRSGRVGPHAIVNQLRIEIKGLFTECCQPSLYLERTVRARLTFRVIPWYAVDSANAPEDESVRLMTSDTAQRYVDDLFARGVSEEFDPQKIPAAQLQFRSVTGLSSLLGRDDFSGIRPRSQTSSDQFSTCGSNNIRIPTSGSLARGKESVSTEACSPSSMETANDMAAFTPWPQEGAQNPASTQESTEFRNGSLTPVVRNVMCPTLGLAHGEKKSISSEKSIGSPPIIFYNRYSPLRGLKDNASGSIDVSDEEDSISLSEPAMSNGTGASLNVLCAKSIQRRGQTRKCAMPRPRTWSKDINHDSGGVAIPVDEVEREGHSVLEVQLLQPM